MEEGAGKRCSECATGLQWITHPSTLRELGWPSVPIKCLLKTVTGTAVATADDDAVVNFARRDADKVLMNNGLDYSYSERQMCTTLWKRSTRLMTSVMP